MALDPDHSKTATVGPAATTAAGVWTVIFLGVTAGVQMSDRGVHALLSPAIKEAFGVGDALLGALHGIAGILVASALAVPIARQVDKRSRKHILLTLIALWTALTALGALSPNFALFFFGRAASGVTEFAMIPVVYSLIPDLVRDDRRVTANLSFAALMAIGASGGFYFGGDLLAAVGAVTPDGMAPWRATLLALSLAGLPLLAAGAALPDPRRTRPSTEEEPEVGLLPFLRARTGSVLLFLGAAGGLAVAVQAVTPMAAMALNRRFAADLGQTGHALGLITLVAGLSALPIAGFLDRTLHKKIGERSRPAIMGAGAAVAIPALLVLGAARADHIAIAMIAAFLAATCIANALIPTMLQDLAPPALRARGFAVYSFVIAAFCAAGPLLSGFLSDVLTKGDLLTAIGLAGAPALALAAVSGAVSALRRSPRA